MRLARLWADERGSAAIEFITAGVVLLVPLVYLILTMAQVQAGAFAVEGASRQAARVFVRSDTLANADANAQRAIEFALADYGFEPSAAKITVACEPRPATCLTRRGYVTVTVELAIPLPLLPPMLSVGTPLSVPVSSPATQQVSRFWTEG